MICNSYRKADLVDLNLFDRMRHSSRVSCQSHAAAWHLERAHGVVSVWPASVRRVEYALQCEISTGPEVRSELRIAMDGLLCLVRILGLCSEDEGFFVLLIDVWNVPVLLCEAAKDKIFVILNYRDSRPFVVATAMELLCGQAMLWAAVEQLPFLELLSVGFEIGSNCCLLQGRQYFWVLEHRVETIIG